MGKLSAVAQQSAEYELVPEGQYTAVLCDWIDMGWVEVTHNGESKGLKPKIKPVFQLDEVDSNDRRFLVYEFAYVISLDKKANLTKMLTAWLTPSGLQKFLDEDLDLDELIGVCASVSIVHKASGEKTYANIGAIMPMNKKLAPIEIEDYTRLQDSEKWAEKQPEHSCWGPKPDFEPAPPPAPVKPARFVPDAEEMPARRSVVSDAQRARMEAKPVDKHDFGAAQERAQATMAKAKEAPEVEDEEDDPFADGG